jgi:hypothetical protein
LPPPTVLCINACLIYWRRLRALKKQFTVKQNKADINY